MQYNNSKRNIVLPIVWAAALILFFGLGILVERHSSRVAQNRASSLTLSQDKLSTILALIENGYVDSVCLDSLTEDLIPKLLAKLDPHSIYLKASEFASANEPLDGSFDGIGVVFNMLTDTVQVLNVIVGGPSDKAGILNGDRILTVDGVKIAGVKMVQDSVVHKLRGPRGSKVVLGVRRQGLRELLQITVERGVIPYKSIDSYFRIAPQTAYLKLSRFSRNSHKELLEAYQALQQQDTLKRLIFDLRGNSGGFLDQAILIANEFLPKGSTIVYTQGEHHPRREQHANGKGVLQHLDVRLLIDEGSASASEIVAGALQDNDRGTIYGRRSFGKGLVQEQIPFEDGSALRLTTARYYTPLGRSIQKPYNKGVESYNQDLMNRYVHQELLSADSIKFADSLRYVTPGGNVLYGGGGIMPDVFVPLDTVLSRYERELLIRGTHLRYAMHYADLHREALNKIQNFSDLDAYFSGKDAAIFADFERYAAKNGVVTPRTVLPVTAQSLKWQLRAYIGRNTPLEDNAFFYYIYRIDPVLLKALKIKK